MEPSLADDEARLREIADALLGGLRAAIPGWLHTHASRVASAADIETAGLDDAVGASMAVLDPEIERILLADPDAGAGSPLAAIRQATRPVTDHLRSLGVPPVVRDAFAEENFRDDVYDFGPAAFGDIDPSLHEPGLMWGAARAHVHLRRRREAEA